MRIHYFQHIQYENLAIIEDWICKRGHSLSCTRFFEEVWFPFVEEIDWLIIMGGYMGAYEEEKFPWLIEEKRFIREAINKNKVVLGICLGSQLIASSLGAKVFQNKEKEIGWHNVSITKQAKDNPMLNFLPEEFCAFQWHGDTFDLPEGAVHIAESSACRNQLFSYKDRVLGMQFHPEVTESSIKDLIENCRDELVEAPFIQSEKEIKRNIHLSAESNKIMFAILENLERLASKT